MDNIDIIFYINLLSRPDRKEHFMNEITKLTDDMTKIHRIDAVYNDIGALGCTQSHIKALELFIANPEWKTCLIFEDDFTFRSNDPDVNNSLLTTLFKEIPDIECFNLAASPYSIKYAPTSNENIKKALSIQTTSGYGVAKSFALTLLQNYIESKEMILTHGAEGQY